MTTDPYVYPGTDVLRNKLDIRDPVELDIIEHHLVQVRIDDGVPTGNFDLPHLQAIHHHLFQDVYEWAGEVRTCTLGKGDTEFQHPRYIETGMADVSRRLEESDYLKGLAPQDFAARAGEILGDVNHVHPFREGNGRTQLLYFEQLADQAGHPVTIEHLEPALWIEASQAANRGDYAPMSAQISSVMEPVEPSLQLAPSPEPEQAISAPAIEPEF